jgi:hypothetical protein
MPFKHECMPPLTYSKKAIWTDYFVGDIYKCWICGQEWLLAKNGWVKVDKK